MPSNKDWRKKDFHSNVLKGKDLINDIFKAVCNGKLVEPFYPKDIKKAIPDWNDKTYNLFPWKHCLQKPNRKDTALFFYCEEGIPEPRKPPYKERKYRLLREGEE